MKPFRWNHDKNEILKSERSISFEEMVLAIEADGLLDVLHHYSNLEKYLGQFVFVISLNSYIYLVPFIEETEYYFLKTIIPSRKGTR